MNVPESKFIHVGDYVHIYFDGDEAEWNARVLYVPRSCESWIVETGSGQTMYIQNFQRIIKASE